MSKYRFKDDFIFIYYYYLFFVCKKMTIRESYECIRPGNCRGDNKTQKTNKSSVHGYIIIYIPDGRTVVLS